MTDITELAQREKFEAWAEERCALPWGYLKNRRTNTGYFSKHDYTSLWAAWKAAGAELVEALEEAQGAATQQGNIACALLDEVTQLRRHADEKAPELRALLIEADSELEVLRMRIAELESRTVSAAAADVLAERQRQITAEGWTPEHDDEYEHGELADAAGCYALSSELFDCAGEPPRPWPWPDEWWKPGNRRRDLVKAGALILAEIERIDRAAGIKWEAE
ncbi:hypothetical protein [Klebsiella michiganensis]|uniref:hypothetical protein n=1 Tax=Klebsiella michiganensis TaxID=1134687 RepID=UPI002598350F|nr:hypothetical protein [Klebsiella michiganensis]MDM4570248.1 hypothetical protein [Klebsiella michiganensis]MDM4587400.1 hypothetical protein [Klebsiella michiganensis]